MSYLSRVVSDITCNESLVRSFVDLERTGFGGENKCGEPGFTKLPGKSGSN